MPQKILDIQLHVSSFTFHVGDFHFITCEFSHKTHNYYDLKIILDGEPVVEQKQMFIDLDLASMAIAIIKRWLSDNKKTLQL